MTWADLNDAFAEEIDDMGRYQQCLRGKGSMTWADLNDVFAEGIDAMGGSQR